MIDLEWNHVVPVASQWLIGFDLRDLDGKAESIEAELLGASQHTRRAARPRECEFVRTALERHRSHQADDADDVVGVKVRKKDICHRERDVVTHHLALRSLAAVEEQRLAFAHERQRGDVALDGRARGRGSEEAKAERHGLGI